jgi:hypothetical protein
VRSCSSMRARSSSSLCGGGSVGWSASGIAIGG